MSNSVPTSSSQPVDTGLRHRNVAVSDEVAHPQSSPVDEVVKAVRKMDVFTKLPDDCRSSGTASGASVTLVTFVLIFLLVCVEVNNYLERRVQFSYGVDPDHSTEMVINVDLVVASPCGSIGMDVLDITGTETHGTSEMEEIPTDFELDEPSRTKFTLRRHLQEAVRQHHHALQSDLFLDRAWRSLLVSEEQYQSAAERKANSACRLKGRFRVNKVAGNLHLTGGKPVNFGGTHAHFQASHATALNFSHRIYHLSFGADVPGRINPLDFEEKLTEHANMNYQYFVQVVPTELHRRGVAAAAGVLRSFQYAVQELDRVIDHSRGSHGLPGLFFKYEVSPLQVRIQDAGLTLASFLTNLAAITGGVFACSALVCYALNAAAEKLTRHLTPKASSHLPVKESGGLRYASPLS